MKTFLSTLDASSQAEPGFRFMALPTLLVYLLAAAFIVAFFAFSGVISAGSSAVFLPPKAFASVHSGGAAYSQSQERRILRAVSLDYDNIGKLDGHGVRVVLDEPDMVRADLPTVLWQYRTERCVRDVHFRSDERDAENAPVIHYETRSRDSSDDIAQEECLSSFIPRTYGPRMVSVSAFYKSYIH